MRREATEKKHFVSRLLPVACFSQRLIRLRRSLMPLGCCFAALFLSACESEIIRQQEEQIRRQQEEIARQRNEIQELLAAKAREEQKRRDCNRAFRDYFEKAQGARDPAQAVSLYREGLRLCPDDDVAHYELARLLRRLGQVEEARKELEAALRINPDFQDAREQLEALKRE